VVIVAASNWWNDLPTVPPEQFENMCILYSDFQVGITLVIIYSNTHLNYYFTNWVHATSLFTTRL